MIGEILITLTVVLDFIHSNPLHTTFRFTPEQIEAFLIALIDKEIGHIRLLVSENNKSEPAEESSPVILTSEDYFELIKHHSATIGMKFLINQMKDA